MSLFDLFKKQAPPRNAGEVLPPETELAAPPADDINAHCEDIINRITELTTTDCICLSLKEEETNLFSSKLGGVPYWDLDLPYPKDGEGNRLALLLQLNFATADLDDARLPQHGMLQFFITGGFDTGFDEEAMHSLNGCKVIYHPTLNEALTEEAVTALGIPTMPDSDLIPVVQARGIALSKGESCISVNDYRFPAVFRQAVKDVCGKDIDGDMYDVLDDDGAARVCHAFSGRGHRLFGYPSFTQCDPREGSQALQDSFNTLLLQLDSEYENGDTVMWGDCGIGFFTDPVYRT